MFINYVYCVLVFVLIYMYLCLWTYVHYSALHLSNYLSQTIISLVSQIIPLFYYCTHKSL